ncbi:conserved exported hypothetical protein [uncultured Desulfobacterium sp.]|uniref:OmpA-like domain-containing protein n=1 Tax=uncultured Desulfobacterium sp. TaxID=201089 RepID=A0A445MXI1_9BACT|nr:conserved exported hypothetical protein [uncultured Desulfobacterium sp.]
MRSIKAFLSGCLMVFVLFMSQAVSAEIRPGAFTISPLVGGYFFEGNQDLDDELAVGVGLGYQIDEHWGIEGVFNYVDTTFEDDGFDLGVDTYIYHIDALYHFMPSERLVPYLAAGAGGIIFDPRDEWNSDQDFAVNYGGGLKYFLTENVALRADVRHVISFDETQSNLLATAGIIFYIGGEKAPVKAPEVVEPPPKPKVVEPPKDSDGDGVPDSRDRCPNTPKGVTVNEVGCWVCKYLNFDFDKWDIKPQYYPCLNEGVEYLKSKPTMKVEIQGHTDNIGSQKYNQKLSEKRAMEVMDYLVSKGIEKERLCAKGFGFSDPVASNDTEEGRAKNRRVQFNPISD